MVKAQTATWEPPFPGNNPDVLYYPDQQAVYFRYAWQNKPGRGLVIKGKLPDARYFSFNLYNDYTKSGIAALADYQVKPDEGDSTAYTIHLLPEGSPGRYKNLVIIPDSIAMASVFLRYYLPRGSIYAGQPLPVLSFLENGVAEAAAPSIPQPTMSTEDMAKLKSMVLANPGLLTQKEKKTLGAKNKGFAEKEPIICKLMTMPIFAHYTNPSDIDSYKFNPGGNYPNKDNHYCIMPVIRRKKEVLVVRFRPPVPGTKPADTTGNVRYFSLSQGNEYTNTSVTLYDEQLRVSQDGFIYVMVANDDAGNRKKAGDLGLNFMPWLYKERLVLILRHMLPAPGFNKSIREVPLFNKNQPAAGQAAKNFIGEYALSGRFFSASALKAIASAGELGF